MNRLLLPAAVLVSMSGGLDAQTRPGQNVVATVRVSNISRQADTTTISYRIVLSTSTPETLMSFTVNGAGVPLSQSSMSTTSWLLGTTWRGRTVAQWTPLDSMAAGDSTPLLVVRGVGLPGVTDGWVRGFAHALLTLDSTTTYTPPAGDFDPLDEFAVKTPVVGIDPYPTASLAAYASRLASLSAAACLNGWITDATLCTRLQGLSSAAPARVPDFLTAVETGNAAGHMNSLAYWMLKVNGEAARDFLERR